jgi:hypothetical protein
MAQDSENNALEKILLEIEALTDEETALHLGGTSTHP